MMHRLGFLIFVVFTSFFSRHIEAQSYTFASTYQQWIDPNNSFIDYFTVDNVEQARVIFIGSQAYGLTGPNYPATTRPTVSEGMGYGLLLAVANNDQTTFNKFLNYVIGVANSQGCSLFSGETNTCLNASPFLMPWVVNEDGQPFWYLPNSNPNQAAYFSSGSATDADIQIAWALQLASEKVKSGNWQNSTFSTVSGTLTYEQILGQMALAIRLDDIDLRTLRYTPGNQWGRKGKTLLYTGYFTPQAFLALDQVPPPVISTDCPDFSTITPPSPTSTLQIVFINNSAKSVSIDYLGGATGGTLQVISGFVPKEGVTNGFTVGPLVQATALYTAPAPGNYNNVTLQASHYSAQGFATIRSNYFFEFTNNAWTVTDKGSTPKASTYCQSPSPGNVIYVFLTEKRAKNLDFKFTQVLKSSLNTIIKKQDRYLLKYDNTLLPNVIYYSGKFPNDNFSYLFGYDSCRYALWSSGFLQSYPHHRFNKRIKASLKALLSDRTGLNNNQYIQQQSLPTGGIDIRSGQAIGPWTPPAIPLNATVMTAAAILGNTDLFNALSPPVISYQIVNNQPSTTDPTGDSTPYYNAVMVLLSEAILNKKL